MSSEKAKGQWRLRPTWITTEEQKVLPQGWPLPGAPVWALWETRPRTPRVRAANLGLVPALTRRSPTLRWLS